MRVFVISTYPAVRAGLAALVRGQPGWSVVGEAAPDALARQGVAPSPGGAGVDVLLADLDGIVTTEAVDAWLGALRPARGVVALDASAPATARDGRNGEAARLLGEVARVAGEHGLAYGVLRRDASEE